MATAPVKSKNKRKMENVFAYDLREGEDLLWIAQPDANRLFSATDIAFVPFSLLWCGFAIFWETNALRMGGGFFALWGIPFITIGLYMVFGRFIYKHYKKQRTFYAVTNERVLIRSFMWGKDHLESLEIRSLPALNRKTGWGNIGNVTFGVTPATKRWGGRTQNASNTGMEFLAPLGYYEVPGFYDIHDADEVYRLINTYR